MKVLVVVVAVVVVGGIIVPVSNKCSEYDSGIVFASMALCCHEIGSQT
jgi:hypothetical protein